MHTPSPITNTTSLNNMLSFLRKPKSTTVMANANGSETTLVSPPAKQSKPKREYKWEPEFTGMGTLGGMPSLAGSMFVEPPKAKKAVKMVPAQPVFTSSASSFVGEKLSTAQGRESFDTFATSVANSSPSTSPASEGSVQRKLMKQHKAFFNNSFSNT